VGTASALSCFYFGKIVKRKTGADFWDGKMVIMVGFSDDRFVVTLGIDSGKAVDNTHKKKRS